jgi:hypothetical protein
LKNELHIPIEISFIHKLFVGNREEDAMKLGFINSLQPLALLVHPFKNVLYAAPSTTL